MTDFLSKIAISPFRQLIRDNPSGQSAVLLSRKTLTQKMSLCLFLTSTFVIPAVHEALIIRDFSTARPQKDTTLALIEPKMVIADTIKDIPQDEIYQNVNKLVYQN